MPEPRRRLAAQGLGLVALALGILPHASVAWVDGLGVLALAITVTASMRHGTTPLAWFALLGTLTLVAAFAHPDALGLALAPVAGLVGVVALGLVNRPSLAAQGFRSEWRMLAAAFVLGMLLEVVPALLRTRAEILDVVGAVSVLLLASWLLVVAHRAFGPQSTK